MKKEEIPKRLAYHRQEIDFLTNLTTGCANCQSFQFRGSHCAVWDTNVPSEVQPEGCDAWTHDGVPF